MHQGQFHRLTIIHRKGLCLRILFVELADPCGLKVDGVHQYEQCISIQFVEYLLYLSVSLLVTPAINGLQCVWRREVERGSLSAIIGFHILTKQVFKLDTQM